MNVLKSNLKEILRNVTRRITYIRLKQLYDINTIKAAKIANALREAINNNLTSEEKEKIEEIEKLRSELNASSKVLKISDYGAGNPKLHRTSDEMYKGIVTTITVSNACKASKPYFWSLVLFKLLREFRPITCIELGTCLGISAAYQATALKLNNKGNLNLR